MVVLSPASDRLATKNHDRRLRTRLRSPIHSTKLLLRPDTFPERLIFCPGGAIATVARDGLEAMQHVRPDLYEAGACP